MSNADRIAQLRKSINAKLATMPATERQSKDISAFLGRIIDKSEEVITSAPAKTVSAWERFQTARLEAKAKRLGVSI